jgi:quinol monooxygenase YgiN
MSFIQIIEYETDRPDEIAAVGEQMEASGATMRFTSLRMTKDRDKPNSYVTIVEFPSYEAAMENSNAPETQALAAKMAELSTGPARFHNLDVTRSLPQ